MMGLHYLSSVLLNDLLLLDQVKLRFSQDAIEVLAAESLELDSDRQPAL